MGIRPAYGILSLFNTNIWGINRSKIKLAKVLRLASIFYTLLAF